MINISFKAKNIYLTEEDKSYAEKKMERVIDFLEVKDNTLFYEVEKDLTTQSGKIFRVEARIADGKTSYYASSSAETITAAMDDLKDKFFSELRKTKDKKNSKFRRGARALRKIFRME